MHCYFDILAPDGMVADRKGVEVADLEQALEEAQSAIQEMREDDPASARAWEGCELKITDSSGVLLTSLVLDDADRRHQSEETSPDGEGQDRRAQSKSAGRRTHQ